MNKVVSGVFDDYGVAEKVIDELEHTGIAHDQISVLGSTPRHASSLSAAAHPSNVLGSLAGFTAAGAVGGGALGLASISIPGVGLLLASGPWFAALSGAAAGTYVGFLAGAISKLDIDVDRAKLYETQLTQGRILVGVTVNNIEQEKEALAVFDSLGAIDIREKDAVAA